MALVPRRLEHLVAPRAQLGGAVLLNLVELYTPSPSTMPCPNTDPLTQLPDGFYWTGQSIPGLERAIVIRDNHGLFVILELVTYNPIADVLDNPLP